MNNNGYRLDEASHIWGLKGFTGNTPMKDLLRLLMDS